MTARREHGAEERTERNRRVAAAKTALRESSQLSGRHLPAARSALKEYLRHLNEPNQPSTATFELMLRAPFTEPRRR